jgi:pimeloyl-ACP methyl ester carboxylesterase
VISHLHETAPTQFVEANGIRFAYRRFGKSGNVPLLFLQYFAGNMDNWDPTVTNGFAADREVILFDNAGIASSGGETPNSVKEMTRDCLTFLDELGLERIDVVGFSLGGMIAQQLVLDRPQILRRIMLLGTGPSGGEGMTFAELSVAETADEESLLSSAFFAPTATSQAAGKAFLQRLKNREKDRDPHVSKESAQAQLNAIREWGTIPPADRYATLRNINHRTLVVHGNNDQVVPPINSLILAQRLPDAQLIVYPDSAHGAQYQHADLFLKHAKLFLSE